jgi:polysaccharide export outer membrane protein
VKYSSPLITVVILLSFTGCALIPGLQTYDLPKQGQFSTEQGALISVIQLSQDNIPSPPSYAQQSPDRIQQLFNKQQEIYTLSSGDILSIQLWAYPEISPPIQIDSANVTTTGYPIDPNGYIQLPLIGRIHVAGKNLAETNRYLNKQFSRYLKHPDVVVRIISYEGRRYYVNGQVIKSGQYTLNDQPISVYTALGMAGGIDTKTGDNTRVQLIRDGLIYDLNILSLEKQGLSLHKLLIQPNDTLFVNTKQDQKLYIMGESSRNTAIELRDQGMSLSDVLGESEGISVYSASAARIFVMRTDLINKTSTLYHLDLSNIGNLALANQFAMQKNDIVYIDATGLTRWQRVINQIVPFSSVLYSINQLGKP